MTVHSITLGGNNQMTEWLICLMSYLSTYQTMSHWMDIGYLANINYAVPMIVIPLLLWADKATHGHKLPCIYFIHQYFPWKVLLLWWSVSFGKNTFEKKCTFRGFYLMLLEDDYIWQSHVMDHHHHRRHHQHVFQSEIDHLYKKHGALIESKKQMKTLLEIFTFHVNIHLHQKECFAYFVPHVEAWPSLHRTMNVHVWVCFHIRLLKVDSFSVLVLNLSRTFAPADPPTLGTSGQPAAPAPGPSGPFGERAEVILRISNKYIEIFEHLRWHF